ncbi:MAG TPA: PIG-L family deacetylase [Fredinandcohnia sp.]|nr:PIG-L family deacetylase [Fredinandcohnia sp.]
MKRLGIWVLAACVFAAAPSAQAGREASMHAGELAHALDRLGKTARVLYVAAHPDDENTHLLAYLASGEHLQVAYLSLTRGGGGQNLIGAEKGPLLDLVRTEELLAARRIDGARQFFTNARDFGYSKRLEEALEVWGEEAVLADVVWIVRSFEPDVIVARFDETPPNHGHHMASARLARLAFEAAADPKRFPEQLRAGVRPWKAERLLYNVSKWRHREIPEGAIPLEVGGYDARLGLSYGEIAALSRSEHKSQGFGRIGERGKREEHFVWLAGSRPKEGIFDGIPMGWERYGEAARPYVQAMDAARAALDRDRPEAAIPHLFAARAALDALPDEVRVREARAAIEELIARAAGIFVRLEAPRPAVAPGGSLPLRAEVVVRRPVEVELEEIRFPGGEVLEVEQTLPLNEVRVFEATLHAPERAPISVPSWLRGPATEGRFAAGSWEEVGRPRDPAPFAAGFVLRFGDARLEVRAPLVHVYTDRVHGERIEEVQVAPPGTLTPAREAILFPLGKTQRLALTVRAMVDVLEGTIHLDLPAGWTATPAQIPVRIEGFGQERVVEVEVRAAPGAREAEIRPRLRVGGRDWAVRADRIDYPHIPPRTLLRPVSIRLVPAELEIPSGLVGYLPGAGDSVAEDLAHVGVRVEILDEQTLRTGDLDRFDAIVLGVRAHNTRPELGGLTPRLLDYVHRGGTLLVQYLVANVWAPFEQAIGPYELRIGPGRVTDETAAMEFVDPAHPLLLRPHRIEAKDFEGWVQERGLYFAASWDQRYQPLFRCADPGEAPQEGSVVVANHGAGRFVYTGLSFFRQLPAGVPGAYRLFLNLIAREPRETPVDQAAR